MRLIQFEHSGRCCLGVVRGDEVTNLTALNPLLDSTCAAFLQARRAGRRLADFLEASLHGVAAEQTINYPELLAACQVLPPITEVPGSHLLVSGTGLTHTGSVLLRDQMHGQLEELGPKSDSRKIFDLGLRHGRPTGGRRGVAPEWFYKGDGSILRGPGRPLEVPPFAPDGGEEPEIVGIYVIDAQGVPCRLGFAQGNEWSDHVTEKLNYLYLAPSKLRTAALGPELITDLAFDDVRGCCRVFRDNDVLYDSGELRTGERNMCHSLANLEDHHFKFAQHRRPGDIHVHFLGTSKLSFPNRHWQYQTGDVVEVAFVGMGAPLRNPVVRHQPNASQVTVSQG